MLGSEIMDLGLAGVNRHEDVGVGGGQIDMMVSPDDPPESKADLHI